MNMDANSRNLHSTPRVDQSAYNYTESQAATTYAGSMAETSNNDQTNVSTYSYRSNIDAARFLRQAYGRTINAVSDSYFLPSDDDEWNRLDKQHTAIVLGLGGLYPEAANVPAILKSQGGETKRILDLGCGTGVWAVGMAREFPHAQVVGVDLAPVPEVDDLPPNVRFEVDDLNLGLDHHEGQFDLVHIRLVGSGLKNIRQVMADAEKCLKPGGLVLWLDIDYDLYSQTNFVYKPVASELNPSGVWLQRPIYEMRRSAVLGGSDVHEMEKALDEGLWDSPLLDPATCKTASLYLLIGPWATGGNPSLDQYMNYVGSLMRQDIMSGHRAIHPLLIRTGWSKETVNEWSDKADKEMEDCNDKMSLRIRIAWGRRRAAEDQPAPSLPAQTEDTEAQQRHIYPYMFVYNTKEEAYAQILHRTRDKPTVAPLHPADARERSKA